MLNRAVKASAALAGISLSVSVLAGCTTAPETPQAEPTATEKPVKSEVPEPSATPEDPDACKGVARISIGEGHASVTGTLVDRGARELAAGTVNLDDEGNIVSYTVAPGDAMTAIGDRLCIWNALSLAELNHTRTIHPDQVLRLNPDPDVYWLPYCNPDDAPAGFQQIPYQAALEAMGRAADVDDIDTMRAIWADEMSAMFLDRSVIDTVQQALDAGDPHVLRQMFS
ncbi:hypothetical protein [Microbacterium sp. NPDC056234]|uniref:hypothetical protein n=1 Tax=Microbacterium sp. NPDC056234 TaxID=3345757 RepID=UPI0035D9A9DF